MTTIAERPLRSFSPKVGDELVLFSYGRPCTHNSQKSPQHPCRGRILKITKTFAFVETIGAPIRVPLDNSLVAFDTHSVIKWAGLPVVAARVVYRDGLRSRANLSRERIDQLVSEL